MSWKPLHSPRMVWFAVLLAVAGVAVANWRLVQAAISSEPDCVPHLRAGAGAAGSGRYSAARSACTPPESQRQP